MPDKKLTDNEIKKALEKLFTLMRYEGDLQGSTIICNAFDLINRLQAENERLKAKVNHFQYLHDVFTTTPTNRIKAEAYKEFAEEILELFPKDKCNTVISRVTVKNILKDLVSEQPPLNDVKCIECEYLELELPYGVCSKAYKGIVSPNDSCGKGKLKELVGDNKC